MTKRYTIHDTRPEQLSLPFKNFQSFNLPAGSFRRAEAVQEALRITLKDCLMSRDEIADEMSRLLGEKVTVNHIANWVAESKNGWRMPLEYVAAFSAVINDSRVIKAAFSGSGINVLDDSEMVFFEIGKAVEEKRERDARLKENRDRLKKLRMQGRL